MNIARSNSIEAEKNTETGLLENSLERFNEDPRLEREDYLRTVQEMVQSALGGTRIRNPIVNFWGVTGAGKTWLLLMLQNIYRERKKALPVYFSAVLHSDPEKTTAQSLCAGIAAALREFDPSLQVEGCEEVIACLRSLADNRKVVPLILLDDTETVDDTAWREVEYQVILPLAQQGRVLFVIAGRNLIRFWNHFEVRRRVQTKRVEPFSKTQIEEMLRLHGLDSIDVEVVYPYTAGNPRLTRDLIEYVKGETTGSVIDRQWLEQHGQALLPVLDKYRQEFLKNVPSELVPALEAVMPLRGYRSEALQEMMHSLPVGQRPEGGAVAILRRLGSTDAVSWNSDRREYQTDPTGRRILNRARFLEDRDRFCRQHLQALRMYENLAEQFPAVSERYILEAWFHLATLEQAMSGQEFFFEDFPDGAERRRGFDGWLDFARRKLTRDRYDDLVQELLPESGGVQDDSRVDQEILDLLSAEIRDGIRQRTAQ